MPGQQWVDDVSGDHQLLLGGLKPVWNERVTKLREVSPELFTGISVCSSVCRPKHYLSALMQKQSRQENSRGRMWRWCCCEPRFPFSPEGQSHSETVQSCQPCVWAGLLLIGVSLGCSVGCWARDGSKQVWATVATPTFSPVSILIPVFSLISSSCSQWLCFCQAALGRHERFLVSGSPSGFSASAMGA